MPKNSNVTQLMWTRNVLSPEFEVLVPRTFSGGLYIQYSPMSTHCLQDDLVLDSCSLPSFHSGVFICKFT